MTTLWCAGCGDLGSGIGQIMRDKGWNVLGLRRNPPDHPPFAQIAVDLLGDSAAALAALPAPDYVVYTVTPARRTEEDYRAVYDEGVRRLLTCLPPTLKRFILVSSTGVYHQTQGEWVDEHSPALPAGFSGQALLAGERHVLESGLPATVVRLSGIYGPGRHRLVERARRGQAAVRTPPVWTNRIHRDDAVGFIAHLLQQDQAGESLDDLYIATDDAPANEWDVMCAVHEMLGLPPPPEAPAEADLNKRLRNERLHASGYRLRFPGYREGYADMIRQLR